LTFEPWVACSHHRCKQTPLRLWGVPAPWLKGRVDHLYASLYPHASSWQVEWCLRGNEWSLDHSPYSKCSRHLHEVHYTGAVKN